MVGARRRRERLGLHAVRRAADLSPDALSPRLTLAQLYNENGSYPLAVRTYRRAHASSRGRRALTLDDRHDSAQTRRPARRVESARAVVAIDNTSAAAHLNLGTALEAVMLGAENRTDPAYQPALDEAVAAFTRAQSLGFEPTERFPNSSRYTASSKPSKLPRPLR